MYLNYYSQMRNTLTGDADAMIAQEQDKIVTKIIEQSNWSDREKIKLRMQCVGLCKKIVDWLEEHPVTEAWYTEFRIPKRSGGYRTLHAPITSLKELQREVLTFLTVDCKLLCHNAVHSFVKHRNCKTALAKHQKSGARWFLKIDIKDFFDNCTQVNMLAMLKRIHPLSTLRDTDLIILMKVCFYNNALPQGAPTSPLLSNLYLMQFDYELTSSLRHYTYTRYADDILISSTTSFQYVPIVQIVNSTLPGGLVIKQDKLRYGSCNGSNWNLGLMYNKDREVTVGYRNKHLVKNKIHNLFTHIPERDTPEWLLWVQSLCELKGILAYYMFIEPEYFRTLIQKYQDKGYDL